MKIHPSVVLNISEHLTRAQANKSTEPVLGALLGKSETIVDTFEFIQDARFYAKKLELVKQVSPELDVIGWYSAGQTPLFPSFEFSGKVYLQLDATKRNGYLPIQIFTSRDGELIETEYTVVTDDVEIIGLEHAKGADARLYPQWIALKRLRQRIKLISNFVKDVQSGALPATRETFSVIKKIAELTSKSDSKQYLRAFNIQCNDVALQTYLAMLIKGCDVISSKTKTRPRPKA